MSTQGSQPPSPTQHPPWLTRRNIKLAVWILCAVAALIILWQNWVTTDCPVLFFTITMPRSLLLILMLAIGFVLGLTLRFTRHKRA